MKGLDIAGKDNTKNLLILAAVITSTSANDSLSFNSLHNSDSGESTAEIVSRIEHFCQEMIHVCERVLVQLQNSQEQKEHDREQSLRMLDAKQLKLLDLFRVRAIITAKDIEKIFGLKPRTARALCQKLVEDGFLIIIDSSKKARTYGLGGRYNVLLKLVSNSKKIDYEENKF